MSILVIAESNGIEVDRGTLSAITAAQEIGDKINLLILEDSEQVINKAKKIKGVSNIITTSGDLQGGLAENLAPLISECAKDATHVLSSAGTFGKNIMPRVSALNDSQQISDICEIIDADTFVRPIYAGNALATVKSSDKVKFITVRSTAFQAANDQEGDAEIVVGPVADTNGKSTFVKRDLSESDRPELTAAKIVVSGGRGIGSADNFSILDPLADKLGAAVGASRAAVDAGYVPNDYQVGQTGKVVAPELYIAVGISGAIQHLAGMKDSKTIVAINKDEDAPIFQIADYGLVGDLFEVIPELSDKI
ncbi:MAG: FAD-binding protein [Alphaproteobacteria bacterium]